MLNPKYSNCFVIDFENFPNCLPNDNNRGTLKLVGYFGSNYRCYLAAKRGIDNGEENEYFHFGLVFYNPRRTDDKIEFRYKCYMMNQNEPDEQDEEIKETSKPFHSFHGIDYTMKHFNMEEVLDEENGWVKDGKLRIKIEITVDAIIGSNGLRRWGFPRFMSFGKQLILLKFHATKGDSPRFICAYREIINFHAPSVLEETMIGSATQVETFLQLLHGVSPHFQFSNQDLHVVILISQSHKIGNVYRVCEQQIIQKYYIDVETNWTFKDALDYNLKSFLKTLLEKVKTSKELKKLLEKEKWEKSSAEIMKHLVAKFFFFV